MKISKQQLENLIREELEKELEEGFFDALKGGVKKVAGDVGGGMARAAGAAKQKFGQAASAAKQYGQDVKAAGQAASQAADKKRLMASIEATKQAMSQKLSALMGQADKMGMEQEAKELETLIGNLSAEERISSERDLALASTVRPPEPPAAPSPVSSPPATKQKKSQNFPTQKMVGDIKKKVTEMAQTSSSDSELYKKLLAMPREQRIAAIDAIQKDHMTKFGQPKFRISALAALGYYTRDELDDMGYDPS